jgi:uncharacterized protein YlxW (UPF0749 family)
MSGLAPISVTDREDSMRLLYLVLDDANHTFGPPLPKGGPRKFRTVFLGFSFLLMIGLLFGTAIGMTRTLEPIQDTTRKQLQDRIIAVQDQLTQAQDLLELRNLDLEQLRSDATNQSIRVRNLASSISELNALSGYTAIRGDAVRVSIQASVKPSLSDGVDLGVVLDSDISRVVNGLLANGAVAISVNNYRITSKSAIRSAGQAILVGYQALSPPYEITAIGNVSRMIAELKTGMTGEDIDEISSEYGVRFKITQLNQATVPESAAPIRSQVSIRILK